MTSERDVFELSGPVHLTSVNWNCPHHQRSVAASLVQGAYVLERDRQLNRQGPEACAPPWWESFNFKVIRKLVDDVDFSIFGAVYEFNPCASIKDSLDTKAPRFVIVFRGTVKKKESVSRDIQLDLHFIRNGLHRTSRFFIAMQAVRNLVAAFGHQNVWVAGHSLGAAMATLAGKNMAKEGRNLKAFLFNPPFVAAPIERIKDKKVKQGIRIASSFITAGLTLAVKGPHHRSNSFAMLSSWVPCLFVNKADDICSAYIGYFEHRKKMEEIGAGNVGKLATQNSVKDLFLSSFGMESESLHLLPSANLTVNSTPAPDFKHAHGIHQWWSSDLRLESIVYLYD
ncbi:GDSL esterase/lipase [Canna indica]|uniref:GDSL esterase/lipase n=1 Tax=Canna indica TaxID=4628 RepID=A0AAQ3PW33_9LILI|nr:GDSL esterase/lipase [Canna indica]